MERAAQRQPARRGVEGGGHDRLRRQLKGIKQRGFWNLSWLGGKTTYTEQMHIGEPETGQYTVFETKPMMKPLHLTGQPMLDLWLMTDSGDGHIAAELEVDTHKLHTVLERQVREHPNELAEVRPSLC